MKKTFFTSIAVSATLVSGIVLGTLDAGSASACAFAKAKGIFGSNTTFPVDANKLILGVAAATGAITVAGVLSYRRFHSGQPYPHSPRRFKRGSGGGRSGRNQQNLLKIR